MGSPFRGFDIEKKTLQQPGLWERLMLALRRLVAFAIFRFNRRVGGFDPTIYRRQLVDNTDFRKFDDGLAHDARLHAGTRRRAGEAADRGRSRTASPATGCTGRTRP